MLRRSVLRLIAAAVMLGGAMAQALAGEPPPGFSTFEGATPPGGFEAIALPDLDKSSIPLRSAAGEPVLLHVFATWCEPCREELPRLAALAAQASPPALYLVSLAEPADRIRRFMARIGVKEPVQIDADRALTRALGISSLPTTIVLDGALTPRYIAEGDIDWSRAEIQAWLATLSPPANPTRP